MTNFKTLLAAAALTVATASGIGAASAQPYYGYRHVVIDRNDRIDHVRLHQILRAHDMRMIGFPRELRGDRYVVRVQDRFGRVHMVQVNTHNGVVVRL